MNDDDRTVVYIYALIDPRDNEVRYIGQTVNLSQRFRKHLTDKRISSRKRAWLDELLLLGKEPIMKVIEQCNKGNAGEREQYWIADYRNLNTDLLNISNGGAGHGSWTMSDEIKKKISDANKGRTFTDETRKKLSDAGKRRTFTDETRKKISDSQKGKPHPRRQRPVAQYDLDGVFMRQFPSGKEASAKTGIDAKSISRCVNNNPSYRQAGGFLWKKVVGDALMIIEPVRPHLARMKGRIVSEESKLKMSISAKKRYQK